LWINAIDPAHAVAVLWIDGGWRRRRPVVDVDGRRSVHGVTEWSQSCRHIVHSTVHIVVVW